MGTNAHQVYKANLLVALSGILYGFLGFLGTKVLEDDVDIAAMLFWRFAIAGVWMIPFIIKNNSFKEIFSIDKKILFFTLAFGAIGYAGSSGFYFMACEYTGTGLAMVIFFSYPILIALTTWITEKNSFNFKTLVLLIIMVLGLVLVSDILGNSSSNSIDIIGIGLSIASAISYTIYMIGTKKYISSSLDSNMQTMLVSFGSAILYLILSLKSDSFYIPYSPNAWFFLVGLGVLVTALPIQLMIEGLKKISSMRASIISVLEPLITILVGVLLLEESLSVMQVLGIITILGSTIFVQFQRKI